VEISRKIMKINDLRNFAPALSSIFGQGQRYHWRKRDCHKKHREHKERNCPLCALLWLIISQFPGPLAPFPNPLQNVKQQVSERSSHFIITYIGGTASIFIKIFISVSFLSAHPALAGRAVCLLRSSHAGGQRARSMGGMKLNFRAEARQV
jgi:hypothetical protein